MIYFVATEDGKFIRIGYTDDPDRRFSQILAKSRDRYGCDVKPLGFFPGHTGTEQWIQLQFAHLRDHGDWFEFDNSIRRFIRLVRLLPPSYRSFHSLRSAFMRAAK